MFLMGVLSRQTRLFLDALPTKTLFCITNGASCDLAVEHVRNFRATLLLPHRPGCPNLSPNGSVQSLFRFAGIPGSLRTIPNCTIVFADA
jgi:hypothetical protein